MDKLHMCISALLQFIPMPKMNPSSMGHKDKIWRSHDCPVITKALILGVEETFTASAVKRLNIQNVY